MTIEEFEKQNKVKLILKKKSRFMRFSAFFLGKGFMENFWTTYRLPFKGPVITYPDSNDISKFENIPDWAVPVLEHEMIHVEDLRSTWGLVKSALLVSVLPLPVLFSGRWFLERHAYLHGMVKYGDDVDERVEALWNGYFYPWPKSLMKKWFLKKIAEHKGDN